MAHALAGAVDLLPRKLLVYDCVDEYTDFPDYRPVAAWIAERERRLCSEADLVFTTSSTLQATKEPLAPGRTHLVHNVGDAEHFGRARDPSLEVPADIARLRERGQVVGLVGAVSDYELEASWLLQVARSRPAWQLAVVGPVSLSDPTTDVSALLEQPNIHLLGVRPYADLPACINGFDVGVIPTGSTTTRGGVPHQVLRAPRDGQAGRRFEPAVARALLAGGAGRRHRRVLPRAVRRGPCPPRHRGPGASARVALAEQSSWPRRIGAIMGRIEQELAARSAA